MHVYTLNSGLLHDLEAMEAAHEEVGDIFDKIAPYLKIYWEYIKVFDNCNVFLSGMNNIPDNLKIQKQLMSSLLITPVSEFESPDCDNVCLLCWSSMQTQKRVVRKCTNAQMQTHIVQMHNCKMHSCKCQLKATANAKYLR